MERLEFPRVGEEMYRQVLDNGLTVFVFPKPEYQKCYAFFAACYGGMDLRFEQDGVKRETPAGVAHFLEHKMFDTPQGNALQTLAEGGASPNAFTSNDITGYYFESTDHFEDNLRVLLSFVSVPYFTQESVDKEQGIIGQEIGMIEDNPDWKVMANLLAALYRSHPIRVSVAGSVESISHITADTLYACHRAFYRPANMVLCVAGNVDPQRVAAIAAEVLPSEGGSPAAADQGQPEPEGAGQTYVEQAMAVAGPVFQIGVKGDVPPYGGEGLKLELLGDLACEMLLGSSTPLYARLYRRGLINRGFTYGCQITRGASFLAAGGESKDPKAVRRAVLEEAERVRREGLDEALWQRVKKGVYGARVRGLNTFENLCVGQAQSFFGGGNLLDFPQWFAEISRQDVEALIARWVTEERTALSVIRPKEVTA